MKKLVVILLLFVYGVTTVGATVHLHFCMNKFVGWDFSENENRTCSKCGMKDVAIKKGCCKDEHKQLKIDNDHQKSTVTFLTNELAAPIILSILPIHTFAILGQKLHLATYNLPPHTPPIQRLHILYCTYLI